jgi:hypothetical protein
MAWGGFFDPRYAGNFQFAIALEFAIQAFCQFKEFHRGLLGQIAGCFRREMPSNHSTTKFGVFGCGLTLERFGRPPFAEGAKSEAPGKSKA